MVSDKSAARKWYQDFLTLWKDADPDIPILIQLRMLLGAFRGEDPT